MRPSILVAILVFYCAAPAAAQEDCEDWGASHFFSAATAEEVRSCLDAGADVNARLELGATPLHVAAYRTRHPEVIAMLVEVGADVNARDGSGATPLDRARSAEVVNALAAAGAETRAIDDRGRTALHGAARRGRDSSTIAALVAVGVDLNARDLTGRTALHEAAERGRAETVAALVVAGADVDSPDAIGNTPLHAAWSSRRRLSPAGEAIVQKLLELGADPTARNHRGEIAYPADPADECAQWNTRVFMRAATPDAVAECLVAGVEINSPGTGGDTPLHFAAWVGDPSVVALLLEAGADPRARNDWGVTPLHRAAENRYPDIITLLVGAGADLNARDSGGNTPLLRALDRTAGNDLTIAALLDAGADVNGTDDDREAPIHEAAGRGDEALVRRLLEMGADPNAEGRHGERPLHAAAFRPGSTPDRILALIAAGAEVNARDESGDTPLHHAVWWGRDDNIGTTALLEAGAEVDARNGAGETPLHRAIARRHRHQVDALLRGGADSGARTADGATPLHLVISWEEPLREELPAVDNWGIRPYVSERTRRKNIHVPREESVRRDTAMLGALVRAGADVDARSESGPSPLELATRQARWRLAAKLLELGADPAALEEGSVVPLVCDWAESNLFAVAPVATLESCLRAGADVTARDPHGDTPLHAVIKLLKWNHSFASDAIRTLIAAAADPNARNDHGATPLHLAAGPAQARAFPPGYYQWGSPDLVELLVEAGADVNARDGEGGTALRRAARGGNSAVIARLLELGADPAPSDDSVSVADPPGCEEWPTREFFRRATADVVADCIAAGAEVASEIEGRFFRWDPDARRHREYAGGHTPLHLASSWTPDPAVITLLIGSGADVAARDRNNHTPLHYAAGDNENPAVIAALADAGADVNAVAALGRTPLHQAATNPNPAIVAEVLGRGADVTSRLAGGRTAVHEAASGNRNPAVLTTLLEHGADVDARGGNDAEDPGRLIHRRISLNPWGGNDGVSEYAGNRTPLHEAAVWNGPAVVAALLAAGADVHARADLDYEYEPDATPLYWAASTNPDPAVLELLVRAGADLNARGGYERTPLHIAALRNPVAFPKLLVLGADPAALDREGRTPMDYAVRNVWLQGLEAVKRLVREMVNELR